MNRPYVGSIFMGSLAGFLLGLRMPALRDHFSLLEGIVLLTGYASLGALIGVLIEAVVRWRG